MMNGQPGHTSTATTITLPDADTSAGVATALVDGESIPLLDLVGGTLAIFRARGSTCVCLGANTDTGGVRIDLSGDEAQTLLTALSRCQPIDIWTNAELYLRPGLFDGDQLIEIRQISEDGEQSLHATIQADDRPRILEMLRSAMAPTPEEVAQKEQEAALRREREEQEKREQQARYIEQQAEREREQRQKRDAQLREAAERERRREAEWRATRADLPMPLLSREMHEGLKEESLARIPPRLVIPRLGIVQGGRPVLICGPPQHFKSWILDDLGLAITLGEGMAWGGVPISISGDVLHIEYENPWSITKDRLDRFCRARGLEDYGDVLRHQLMAPTTKLIDDKAEERLRTECWGVAACIIDSLQAGCDEREEEFSRVLGMLKRVTEQTGTTFFVVVHAIKHPERVKGLARLQFVSGRESDSVLWTNLLEPGTVRIEIDKHSNVPADAVQPVTVQLVGGAGEPVRFELRGDAPTKRVGMLSAEERVRRRILRALADEDLSGREVRGEVTGSNETIGAVLASMVVAGEVELDPESGRHRLPGKAGPSRSPPPSANGERPNEIMVPRDSLGSSDQRGSITTTKPDDIMVLPGPSRSPDTPVPAPRPPERGRAREGDEGNGSSPKASKGRRKRAQGTT